MIGRLAKKYIGGVIPIVNVYGVIRPQTTQDVIKRLAQIKPSRASAMAVVINSPGGLPVQSQLIAQKIKDYSNKHNLKLYTFARDVAASGGYMILCAGDHVVADRTSIVGSIGVVFQKMKIKGLLEHFQVDHKQLTTHNKLLQNMLNPYGDLEPQDQEYLKKLCEGAHGKFVDFVKKNRGNKVKDDPSTFSGDVFTGEEGLQRGLVDEVGTMIEVLQRRYPGAKLDFQPQKHSFMNRILSL